ncbi:hypothetical protein FBEOM_11896 [Fusarium beomiforme]|uniref:Uncharacterized protein n=1 Tax=Fusarium beomiforme TaxID=44412 RepID=A0A9P5A8Q7_9HYPO|nr:hypothetical protein FBEOM_11896 [Fusarium beomiforme]
MSAPYDPNQQGYYGAPPGPPQGGYYPPPQQPVSLKLYRRSSVLTMNRWPISQPLHHNKKRRATAVYTHVSLHSAAAGSAARHASVVLSASTAAVKQQHNNYHAMQ